ncbi:MAG: right-handed parallel beta-helix repeat-containing protein, partial [Myxococcota bacterium]
PETTPPDTTPTEPPPETTSGAPAGPRPLDDNPACDWPVVPPDAVDVTQFGAVPDDGQPDTEAFTAAVDAAGVGGTITAPAGRFELETDYVPWSGAYAFALLDGQTLSLDPGAVLAAVPNDLEGSAMIYVDSVRDVTIAGGVLLGDRDAHLGQGGEWGMGIAAYGAEGLSIRRVRAEGFWGDGFYVGPSYYFGPSSDVSLCGVEAVRNRRQGLSITSAVGVTVEDSEFSDTEGTAPEGGIDLEPDPGDVVADVVVRHSLFLRNRTGVYVTALEGVEQGPVSCTIEHNVIEDSVGDGISLSRGTADTVIGNEVRRSGGVGILVKWRERFEVVDNRVEDSVGDGILIEAAEDWDAGEPSHHRVAGNVVDGAGGHGVQVLWTHEIDLLDNTVEGAADIGIRLHVADRNLVDGNTVGSSGGRAQIELEAASDCVVSSNTLGPSAAAYGVWLHGDPTQGNEVRDNVLTGGYTDEAIRDDGQGTAASGNVP